MAVPVINFTTGPATLPDVGFLGYNRCLFSPLFTTEVSGKVVKDEATRTTKWMEYTITVDGYVTLFIGAADINASTTLMRQLLTQQGGALEYRGRGIDLLVNPNGVGGTRDVAWGPIPELLEFQPLGGGLSAKVRWQVKTCILEVKQGNGIKPGLNGTPLLQFNYETSVNYTEDYYSSLTVRGTLEIPMSRSPNQTIRTVPTTADALRPIIEAQIMGGIDLSRFRMTKREFNTSRDKRTLTWDFTAEEKPYMDLPRDSAIARGTYSVRPAKAGMGLCLWLCTLRATYLVRADRPRRRAWRDFLALLRLRMTESRFGFIPGLAGNQEADRKNNQKVDRNAFLIDFNFEEGMYLDSKATTFSASWRLVTTFSHILLASGLWTKLTEVGPPGGNNLWATSMRDISGATSWLANGLDPRLDVIVDFGS